MWWNNFSHQFPDKTWSHREVKETVQDHIVCKLESLSLDLCLSFITKFFPCMVFLEIELGFPSFSFFHSSIPDLQASNPRQRLWNIQINQRKKKRERKEGREGLRKKCKHVVTEWNGNIGYMVTGSKLLTPTEGLPSPRWTQCHQYLYLDPRNLPDQEYVWIRRSQRQAWMPTAWSCWLWGLIPNPAFSTLWIQVFCQPLL